MGLDESFRYVWSHVPDLEVNRTADARCPYAQTFGAWVDDLVAGIREPSIVLVNQAKVLLLDRFFEWYRFVPSVHRLRLGLRGHTCIFQVFEAGYERLKNLELSLTPPLLFLPDKVPPIIGGIFIGEDLNPPADDNQPEEQ